MIEESQGTDGIVAPEIAQPKYQIDLTKDRTVKPQDMIDKVMGDLRMNRIKAILHARRNLRENERKEPEAFSFTDIPLRRFSRETEDPIIEDITGALVVNGSLAESRMGSFYTPDRIYRREDGRIELRGADYYVNLDQNKNLPAEKLDVVERDFRDGVSVLEQVGRPTNEKEFLIYLGVLDYLKIHSLSILHAVTYDERNTQLPEGQAGEDYLAIRKDAIELMRETVRRFYQVASGLPFDADITFENMGTKMEELVRYLRKNIKEDETYKFTYPDVNNSLVILLGSHEAAVQNPEIQTIVGLAGGGTETATVTQMFYEYTQDKSPDLAILPISFHSHRRSKITLEQQGEMAHEIYAEEFNGKSILLVDDNSSSGQTIQTADNIVRTLGASETAVHISEHDPHRVMDRIKKTGIQYRRVFNVAHPGYSTTMGVVDVTPRRHETSVVATAPLMIKKRLKDYYSKKSSMLF